MKKKPEKKLTLSRETLTELTENNLKSANGGSASLTCSNNSCFECRAE